MTSKLKPVPPGGMQAVQSAAVHLQQALRMAKVAGCPSLALKIQSAIKSVGGAERHMRRRVDADTERSNKELADILLAVDRGCRFYHDPRFAGSGDQDTPWSWRSGSRSSCDQHGASFATKVETARHFLSTKDGSGDDYTELLGKHRPPLLR